MLGVIKYWRSPGNINTMGIPRYFYRREMFIRNPLVGLYFKPKDIILGYKKQIHWKWRED